MRRVPVLGGILGIMALSPFLTGPETPAPRSPGDTSTALSHRLDVAAYTESGPAADDGPARRRTVAYRGLRIPVPEGWRVHRLDRDPGRCLRYDRRAIYIGRPGSQAACPAHLVGAADVLHVTPGPGTSSPDGKGRRRSALAVNAAKLARHTVRPTVDHQVRLRVPEAGVTINGRYGKGPSGLQDLIRSIRLTGNWSSEDPPPSNDYYDGSSPGEGENEYGQAAPWEQFGFYGGDDERPWVKGKGFDTCAAPSLSAMRAWRDSYKVSNIYIGGAARACAQPNLTPAWVSSVRRMGYRLVPTYVGKQAPCGKHKPRFTAQSAAADGAEAAMDAVRNARALGIPAGRPIYFDMEYYRSGDTSCREAVMIFLHNWTLRLESLGYVPGVYGSVSSVVRDLVETEGVRRPFALWFAHWDGRPVLYGHPMIPDELWHPHRRIKQYRGGHRETHGGVTINIDSNQVDGRVY